MSRVKAKNPIFVRAVVITMVVIASVALIVFCINIIIKSMSTLVYDLGEKSALSGYEDHVIKNYYDYVELTKKYGIDESLTIENFENNYYVASFQEYDPCAEAKMMDVQNVSIGENIEIEFLVHNKCGWCKKHIALHLIKIDKISGNKEITYNYNYAKKLNCGTIK